MPTTCGFPNCKFRSRYRGQEDNRHFYRIPKRPQVLRQRWLTAIGRTEETVVSQLRICSAHFEGGEKKEGDIPVPDPTVDKQLNIELPPKENKTSDRRRKQTAPARFPNDSSGGSPSYLKETRNIRDFYASTNAFDANAAPLPQSSLLHEQLPFNDILAMAAPRMNGPTRPLVALLDGRDCSVEMPILKDIATVAFCDAQSTAEIHEKVLNEAVAALMYHSIKLEKEDLEKFKALRIVVRIGSGLDNIDVKAATELGIAVCHTPGDCIEEVADFTMSLMLNLYRRTFVLAKACSDARKPLTNEQVREMASGSRKMRGDTLGLLGCGRVGTAVALRAKAFGMHVIFYDPFQKEGFEHALGIERCHSLDELMAKANTISLHCTQNDSTRHVINEQTLKHCKQGVFIINTSRPGLINEADLAVALKTGHVRGAALDVHEHAPYDSNVLSPLSGCPNIINTPHAAWFAESSCKDLRIIAAKEVRKAITGKCPGDLQHCINKDVIMQGPVRRMTQHNAQPPSFLNMQNFGFNNLAQMPMNQMNAFPYSNPLLAMSSMGINPLLMNANQALAQFNPAAALSSLAAQAANHRSSPATHSTPSPKVPSASPSANNGTNSPASPAVSKPESSVVVTNGADSTSTLADSDGEKATIKKEASVEAEQDAAGESDNGLENNDDEMVVEVEPLKEKITAKLEEPEEIAVKINGSRANIDD